MAVTVAWGGTSLQVGLVLLIELVPAVSVAVGLVHAVVLTPRASTPAAQDGISGRHSSECTTLVAIPALLTSPEEIEALLRQLEQHYLSTLDDNLLFALLTDFADAPHEDMPDDEALLAQAARRHPPAERETRRRAQQTPSISCTASANGIRAKGCGWGGSASEANWWNSAIG